MNYLSKKTWLFALPLALVALPGCTRDYKFQPVDMWNMSRLKPYEQVNFFGNKDASQTPPAHTVARGQDRLNTALYYGTTDNGTLVTTNPLPVDAALLQRGQERYNIYCQPCHGLAGYGDGMIVKRGFAKPPSYHIDRLRTAPDGHIFDVITNGYGAMYNYAARVTPRDRWAIVAYVRTLQHSQNAPSADLPAGEVPAKDHLDVEPKIDVEQYGAVSEAGGHAETGKEPAATHKAE